MAKKVERTLGWIQNPSNTKTLQRVVGVLDNESNFYSWFVNERVPLIARIGLLHDNEEWHSYLRMLASGNPISFQFLKGKGSGGGKRADASCSGIVQAAIDAQKNIAYINDTGEEIAIKKPFTDDWTADGFLRWAIALGFINYEASSDKCIISDSGRRFAKAETEEEFKSALGEAYLQYPPVCRVLNLLSNGSHLTKFEIGRKLGFTTEAGFTSFPQNLFVQALCDNPKERNEIKSNFEGSSDKYARMICSWLIEMGWVMESPKEIVEIVGSVEYHQSLNAYSLTAAGLKNLKRITGKSSLKKLSKIVYFEMLSTKAADRDYLRRRRAIILKYIEGHVRTMNQILALLKSKGFEEDESAVREDILGFVNIGMNIVMKNDTVMLADTILHLIIPEEYSTIKKSDTLQIKERVRPLLSTVDLKYLSIIDLAFDGRTNREFEIVTLDLLTNELEFQGKHLGGSRKPDGIVYHQCNGLIIDTKAYSGGYSLPRSQVDEMARYIRENQDRNVDANPNCWWNEFHPSVSNFTYAFISSFFTGQFEARLNEIKSVYHVNGATINAENLLYLAEGLKSNKLSYSQFFNLFQNKEIEYSLS